MLERLIIEDILLIDRLELVFPEALTVLTGETGAGKSILLEALGLALGERASPSLVRPGAQNAQVSAVFALLSPHPVHVILTQQGLDLEDNTLILRRTLSQEGKSRAFINDQPVTASFLKELAPSLVEIHGQFDQLLHASSHRYFLDLYGHLEEQGAQVSKAWSCWTHAQTTLEQERDALQKAQENRDFLLHAIAEIEELSPQEGEAEKLLQERTYLTHRAKICDALQTAHTLMSDDKGATPLLCEALNLLEKANTLSNGRFQDLFTLLNRGLTDVEEGLSLLEKVLQEDLGEPESLTSLDDRLFALKALARKHGVTVDELPTFLIGLQQELSRTEQGEASLEELEGEVQKARDTYLKHAHLLTQKRQKAAKTLGDCVTAELASLRLEKASFFVTLTPLQDHHWGPQGQEMVEFQVKTNTGLAPGPLSKIASGGERSRFMLALKVVLSQKGLASLIVFDEIDAGVGGAVASAIGERLARLGRSIQVLAITHSPQVASYANGHYVVSKVESKGLTTTQVVALSTQERQEEVARMLSGEIITPEARAAAEALLERGS